MSRNANNSSNLARYNTQINQNSVHSSILNNSSVLNRSSNMMGSAGSTAHQHHTNTQENIHQSLLHNQSQSVEKNGRARNKKHQMNSNQASAPTAGGMGLSGIANKFDSSLLEMHFKTQMNGNNSIQ